MLSWATVSLLQDGRSQSDIRQGVTLEVFGEGWSMGPLNARMKSDMADGQGDIKYNIPWTTLGEYLEYLVGRGLVQRGLVRRGYDGSHSRAGLRESCALARRARADAHAGAASDGRRWRWVLARR